MPANTESFDKLLDEWHSLAVGDRKAILKHLPIEQRLAFQRLVAQARDEVSDVATRGRAYRAYSPWLARLIEECDRGAIARIKPPVGAALIAGHQTLDNSSLDGMTQQFAGLLQTFFKRWGELR